MMFIASAVSLSTTVLFLGLIAVLGLAGLGAAAGEIQRIPSTALAQASPGLAGNSPVDKLQGIGLTASHKQIIFDGVANEQEQSLFGDRQVAIGSTVPEAVILSPMPISVKDQVGVLKDFKFVKQTGDNVLIVDPASR